MNRKLLRVLQDGTYQRVGEDRERSVDVRVIAATNRVLKEEVGKGRFREDLFFRLNVFPIRVPPLRERKDDIPLLAQHFLDELQADREEGDRVRLSEANVLELQAHEWPGNVRELRSAIQRALITSRRGRLRFDLPRTAEGSRPLAGHPAGGGEAGEETAPRVLTEAEMQERVSQNIEAALRACDGKVYGEDGAARLLGIPPTTLASRIKKLDLGD